MTDATRNSSDSHALDLFISYASEDKEFARALYEALVAKGLVVWFDEAVLEVGDSLRQRIEDGLRRCRYGVVVLSPAFFEKRWPQRELDGLTARETAQSGKAILPVWHNVDRSSVLSYSPVLADRVAARSEEGANAVADRIVRVLGRRS